jgi:clan AA aspartic protease
MGLTYAGITLTNGFDQDKFEEGYIEEHEIRSTTIRALVDSGAVMLVIPSKVCVELGLTIKTFREAVMANGQREEVPITSIVQVQWNNRTTLVQAAVTGDEVLLGAIPLEGLDVIVDPVKQMLVPHPDSKDAPHLVLKGIPQMRRSD